MAKNTSKGLRKIQQRLGGAALASLVLLSYSYSDAFTPSNFLSTPLQQQSNSFHDKFEAKTFGNNDISSSSTQLSMSFVEDFMSGTDKKTRETANAKYLATLQERVDKINALEAQIEELGDDELTAKTEEFKKRVASGEDINGPILEEAFAVVREAAW